MIPGLKTIAVAVIGIGAPALVGCASWTGGVSEDALYQSTTDEITALFGREPDFVGREGDVVLRRYDLPGCAVLLYFPSDDAAATVDAVTASDPAGATPVQDCLDQAG